MTTYRYEPWEREGMTLAWMLFRYGQISPAGQLPEEFHEERAFKLYRQDPAFHAAVSTAVDWIRQIAMNEDPEALHNAPGDTGPGE